MFEKLNLNFFYVGIFIFVMCFTHANASVVVNGTRVIYLGSEKETTVKVSNAGKSPVLIQSWIDKGEVNDKPENIQVPFILTPPIGRIDPNKSQTLRLSYTSSPALPEDRESVFWLNVLEIPPVTKDMSPNHLQIAFRTRIKLFYRPAALSDKTKAIKAAKDLRWSFSGNKLTAVNDSPYYVSLVSVKINNNVIDGEMVPPKGNYAFVVNGKTALNSKTKISYEFIDDWGAVQTVETSL
ncbi:molecular chaperone [Enterobacter ludwigii]|jgi:chaperone protein EcpD|uniref:fimbrial biogenesis chaperone n=1 Tax=Enterobacter ludwigii TaxID=299767 RepID=UPI002073726D